MDAADFIIGTGAYASSMYLKRNVDLCEPDDPIVVDPPKK